MTIIARTVVAHGGRVEVGDRRGGGALFKVTFPPFGTKRGRLRVAPPQQRPAPALPKPDSSRRAGE